MKNEEIMEIMEKTDEKMQKCNYELECLRKLYDASDNKLEKQLIYAEIRSIEILNTIQIDANGE